MIFSFFAKREKVFEVKGNEKLYRQAKKILRETGIAIAESGAYQEEAPICCCVSKLDHLYFGPNGKIDRYTYYIYVKAEYAEQAKECLHTLLHQA